MEQGRADDAPGARRPHEYVSLVTRLLVAQAAAGGAIGLFFSRRHLPSMVITLVMVAAVCGVAMIVRSGSHAAWLTALCFEGAFTIYGVSRFIDARYVGGTLFAVITTGVLLHPAVGRAFSGGQAASVPEPCPAVSGTGDFRSVERGIGETSGGTLGERG